jgi:type VI secretion system secreted protein VgrG
MSDNNGPAELVGAPNGMRLRSASINESLGRPFRVEMEVVVEGKFLPSKDVLGTGMALQINLDKAEKRFVHGLVSEFHYLGSSTAQVHAYRVILRPWLWFLSRAINCRIFSHSTIPDIIKLVFSKYGQMDVEPFGLEGHRQKEFVVQYRESDLNFVTRLMEDEGLYYFFKHTDSRHTLVLCNSNHIHAEVPKFQSLPYLPPEARGRAQVPCIDSWEITSRVESNIYTTKDFDFEKPDSALLFTRSLPRNHQIDDFEIFDYPGEFREDVDGDNLARFRVEEQHALAESFAGRSNARSIYCGTLLSMTHHPIDDCNAQYLIVSTLLRVTGHALSSGDILSGSTYCKISALPNSTPFRLPRTTPKPHISGAQTAKVVTRQGYEIDADAYGRVRVKFHWDRREDSEATFEQRSCPVRVSQLWAGAGFGGIHIPRKDQEVIVEFLEGDPDRPIITGRVYNFANEVPYELPKHQTQSGIKSWTVDSVAPHYNELRFEDEPGKEEIFIQAERDKTVKVKRARSTNVGSSDTLAVGGSRSVAVKQNLTVKVGDKAGKYSLSAVDSIELVCDKSSIKLTPTGIELNGVRIAIDGMDVVSANAPMVKLNCPK